LVTTPKPRTLPGHFTGLDSREENFNQGF